MKYNEERFKSPEKYIEYLQMLSQDCVSLNSLVGNSEDDMETEMGDMLPSEGPTLEEIITQNSRRNILMDMIRQHLGPREQKILFCRYGFETGQPMTLDEIGKVYKVTRERIRQIENSALRKLRLRLKREQVEEGDI